MSKKKFSILLAICLVVSIFTDRESVLRAQAAASPAPTVKKVTLYVDYENYSIEMENLKKESKKCWKNIPGLWKMRLRQH